MSKESMHMPEEKPEYLLSNEELNTAVRTLLEFMRTPFLNQGYSEKLKSNLEEKLMILLSIQEQRAMFVYYESIKTPDKG